jgi:hypothetical protein
MPNEIKIDSNTQKVLQDIDKMINDCLIRKDIIIRTILYMNEVENPREYMLAHDFSSLNKIEISKEVLNGNTSS